VTLKPTEDLLRSPLVGANVVALEQAEAFVRAAEDCGLPLLLQVSQNAVRYHGALRPLGRALLALAEDSSAEVGVHLDHATEEELVEEAIRLGFLSVMFDASASPTEENIDRTSRVVSRYTAEGVWVEGEIGEIGGKYANHDPRVTTPVKDALLFWEQTQVSGLAVAVGNSHHMRDKSATLDLARIREIADVIPVPLVLHGSSGVPREDIRLAIQAGIRKINVATEFNTVATDEIRSHLMNNPSVNDPREYWGQARDALHQSMVDYLTYIAQSSPPE